MRRAGVVLCGAVWVLASAVPARAHCETSTLLPIPLGVTTFYYDDRSGFPPPQPEYSPLPQVWIYEEANGVDALQRGGEQWLLHAAGRGDLDPEICVESQTPDKLWY